MLYLTDTALDELHEIRRYSIREFGKRAAYKYMEGIANIIRMLEDWPDLLREKPFSNNLKFYPVEKHILACTIVENDIYVLRIFYGGMDIESIMNELEPNLLEEARILNMRLKALRN